MEDPHPQSPPTMLSLSIRLQRLPCVWGACKGKINIRMRACVNPNRPDASAGNRLMNRSVVWTHNFGPRERASVSSLYSSLTSMPSYMGLLIRDIKNCCSIIHREQEHFIKAIFKWGKGSREGLLLKSNKTKGGKLTTSFRRVRKLSTWRMKRFFLKINILLTTLVWRTVYSTCFREGAARCPCAAQPVYSALRAQKMWLLIKRPGWFSVVLR